MNIIADTNVLIRLFIEDDEGQARRVKAEFDAAKRVAVTSVALCELVWMLRRGFKISAKEVALNIRKLLAIPAIETDREAVMAGLAMLDAGEDFADGIIAHEGRKLGGEVFLSFDIQAVKLVTKMGGVARLLSA